MGAKLISNKVEDNIRMQDRRKNVNKRNSTDSLFDKPAFWLYKKQIRKVFAKVDDGNPHTGAVRVPIEGVLRIELDGYTASCDFGYSRSDGGREAE